MVDSHGDFHHQLGQGGVENAEREDTRHIPGQRWRSYTPFGGLKGGGVPPTLPLPYLPDVLPLLARTSPVKTLGEVVPSLEEGLAAIREIPPKADSFVSSSEWTNCPKIARLHSALDYILRTSNCHAKRAGGTGDRRLSMFGERARGIQEQASQMQREQLYNNGVVPLLIQVVMLVSAVDSRQILEDAIQCLCNIVFNEKVCFKLLQKEKMLSDAWDAFVASGPKAESAAPVVLLATKLAATPTEAGVDVPAAAPTKEPLAPGETLESTPKVADSLSRGAVRDARERKGVDPLDSGALSAGGLSAGGLAGAGLNESFSTDSTGGTGVSGISSSSSTVHFSIPTSKPISTVSALVSRLKLDGANCSEVCIKVSRCLSTFLIQSYQALDEIAQQGAARVLLYMLYVHRK